MIKRGTCGIYREGRKKKKEPDKTDRVDETGRQRNETMSRGKIDRQIWQIDLSRDEEGFSCCGIKKRG